MGEKEQWRAHGCTAWRSEVRLEQGKFKGTERLPASGISMQYHVGRDVAQVDALHQGDMTAAAPEGQKHGVVSGVLLAVLLLRVILLRVFIALAFAILLTGLDLRR